ncbi:hypothetical protein LX36DRAFT_659767 [Colletotrichum falcatum]|nr:hypothetical protein LX36DRAFT_659767 [Colletotrichum falcatum]
MAALLVFGNYPLVRLDRSLDIALDQTLGRHLKPTPAHLSRVVHVPEHHNGTTHLPLYDVTETYAKAVKRELIGSNRYKLNLAMMRRPSGDGTDAQVRYLVDFESGSSETDVTVERRVPGHNGETVKMHLPREGGDGFRLASVKPARATGLVVTASFPVPDTKLYAGATPVRHPWFAISHTLPGGAATAPCNLEWQARPAELGTLRYTLVDTAEVADDGEPVVHAIYHHVGIAIGLPADYSEGVLLLSENLNGEAEALAVATLVGLVWQVRSMNQASPRPSKKSLVRRVLCKV